MKHQIYFILAAAALLIMVASIGFVTNAPKYHHECASAEAIASSYDFMLDTAEKPIPPAVQSKYNQAVIDHKIKCSDLAAQWGTADVAILGFIAGLLGLIFIGITVFETRSAASAAQLALKESKDATELIRQEQRPWIFIEREVPCELFEDGGITRLHWFYKMQNVGKTPAFDVHFVQKLYKIENIFHDEDMPAEFKSELVDKINYRDMGQTIIPNQPNRNQRIGGTLNSLTDHIKGSGDKLMLWAGCIYRTSKDGPIGYDIRIYRVGRKLGNPSGPMQAELIHNQYGQEVA